MKFLKNNIVRMTFFLSSFWIFPDSAIASNIFTGLAKTGIDFNQNVVAVWETLDTINDNYMIKAVAGDPPWVPTTLTNPTSLSATNPQLAVASSLVAVTNSCTAVAAWIALDFSTGNTIIQLSTLSNLLVWNPVPITVSLNDGTEIPQGDDIVCRISPDGTKVLVTWTSFMTSISRTVVRFAFSNDGGTTWGLGQNP